MICCRPLANGLKIADADNKESGLFLKIDVCMILKFYG